MTWVSLGAKLPTVLSAFLLQGASVSLFLMFALECITKVGGKQRADLGLASRLCMHYMHNVLFLW